MMNSTHFEVLDFQVRGDALLRQARKELGKSSSEKIRNLSKEIPTSMGTAGSRLEIVFAGQYSAGKSTILRVLTGRDDIATGEGITTQEAHTYEWGDGIRITDTPGIHTQIRPDHDEISYRAIANADLLIFVVTNELFDSHLANHFRKIAIDKEKAHEMMLVVNKMDRCRKGNRPESQEVIREDLRKILDPFTPEDVRLSFIDADNALEGRDEKDKNMAAIYIKKSGFDTFISELNRFVKEKGLLGRYTTALYRLEQILQEALVAESTGDLDVDGLEEMLLQRRRAILDMKESILHAIDGVISRTTDKIRMEGMKVADSICADCDSEQVNHDLQIVQVHSEKYVDQLADSIEKIIDEQQTNLAKRIQSIVNSELAKELLPRLKVRVQQANTSTETAATMKMTADISTQLGRFLLNNSFNAEAGFQGLFALRSYSGTMAHETILSVGKFFGHKFKPWEAVKWAKFSADAGRVLSVAGAILVFALQTKEDVDNARLEKDLRKSRSAIRAGFNDAVHQIETHYDKETQCYIASEIMPELAKVDKELAELRTMQNKRSAIFKGVTDLLLETQRMIGMIHKHV